MARPAVELKVGGQLFRVVATAEEQSLQRYAKVVNDKLRELTGTEHSNHPQAMLLVAIALAHELEDTKRLNELNQARARDMLRSLLDRVNRALDVPDENAEPPPSASVPR
jgi:cell division protein ZapA